MDNNTEALDTVFRALADPTRRAIVQRLGEKPATVSELARPFRMALPSLLKHIGVLEAAGLIATRKAGRVRSCAIRPERLAGVETWLDTQRKLWQGRADRLSDHAETLASEEAAYGGHQQ